jgi:RNA polymerase sigma-70 factor (ECF subfamily)
MNYTPFRNEETRSSVLAGVRAGSEEAWGRFFDLYAGYVFSLARRNGLSGDDADDLVQNVFSELSAPGGFDGYERGKGSFRVWLRRRAQWRIMDALRRRTIAPPAQPLDDPDVFPAPDAALDEAWIEAAREEALRRLRDAVSPEHFAIFQASVLEELPTEDVLRLYRISRDNLYQIRKRVKETFADLLKAALDDLDAPLPP